MAKGWTAFVLMLGALLAIGGASVAQAGDMLSLISPDSKFREEMPEAPRASGQRLLGIQFGDASGSFDRAAFRIALGAETIGSPLCVKVTTRDGRYWSLNPFRTDGVAPGDPALDFRTDLGERLAGYDMSEFAVLAAVQPDCEEDRLGVLVPAVLSGDAKTTLTLMVNAGNPLSVGARLLQDDKPVSETRCARPPSGATVGYNFICHLTVDGLEGAATIMVVVKDMNGISKPESYDIRLPARDGNG